MAPPLRVRRIHIAQWGTGHDITVWTWKCLHCGHWPALAYNDQTSALDDALGHCYGPADGTPDHGRLPALP